MGETRIERKAVRRFFVLVGCVSGYFWLESASEYIAAPTVEVLGLVVETVETMHGCRVTSSTWSNIPVGSG